jgi:hypothetical protein
MALMRVDSEVLYFRKQSELTQGEIDFIKNLDGVQNYEFDEHFVKIPCDPDSKKLKIIKNEILKKLGLKLTPMRKD